MKKIISIGSVLVLTLGVFAYSAPQAFADSDLTALDAEILLAQAAVASSTVGEAPGQYASSSVDTLNAAIAAAEAVTSTQAQSVVDEALVTLTSAVSAFQPIPNSDISLLTAAKATAQGLIDANAPESMTPGEHVVGSLATLSSALAAADATSTDAQSVVTGQVATLNDAIDAYNAAIVPPYAITVAADSKSKTYGGADPPLTYQIVSGSLVDGDSFTGALSRSPGEGIGSYEIAQGTLALNGNYDLSFTPGALAITPAHLTVSGITASDKAYDGTTTASVDTSSSTLNGVVAGDADNVTLAGSATGAFSDKDVGTGKTVNISGLALAGSAAGNYALTQPTATADITPVALAITADSKTKNYRDADPSLTYAITSGSLVGGESIAGALTRVAGENPGTYAINQGTLSAGSNYSITFTPGTLTILNSLVLTTETNPDGSLSATTIGPIEASTTSNGTDVSVNISAGTVMTGPSSWDGTLTLPEVTTTFVAPAPDSGYTASVVAAIAIGAGDTPLTFDQAVELTFAGQAGNLVGWSRGGSFTQITATCDDPSNPTLAAGADCKIDVGSDLIIWTKHFTAFIVYTQAATTPPAPVTGGGVVSVGGGWITPPTPSPLGPEAAKVDANKDNKIDVLDFNALMVNWGITGAGNSADFNGDGTVDILFSGQ